MYRGFVGLHTGSGFGQELSNFLPAWTGCRCTNEKIFQPLPQGTPNTPPATDSPTCESLFFSLASRESPTPWELLPSLSPSLPPGSVASSLPVTPTTSGVDPFTFGDRGLRPMELVSAGSGGGGGGTGGGADGSGGRGEGGRRLSGSSTGMGMDDDYARSRDDASTTSVQQSTAPPPALFLKTDDLGIRGWIAQMPEVVSPRYTSDRSKALLVSPQGNSPDSRPRGQVE